MKLEKFVGLVPRVPDHALPQGAAVVAENVDFAYGELRSMRGDFKLLDLTLDAQSVWSETGLTFYAWPVDVDTAISPLQAGTSSNLLYYTTPTDFRFTYRNAAPISGAQPTASFRVGVPRPTKPMTINVVHPIEPTAPVATVNTSPADTYTERLKAAQEASDAKFKGQLVKSTVTRAYTYTYANALNEEGPPADAATVEVKSITNGGVTTYSTVTFQVTFDPADDYMPITGARVYRTSDAGTSADYYYAMTATPAVPTMVDNVKPAALNELLASYDAYPPDPQLRGLINVGNGILAAFKGNEMWFSDPYRPWSWPPSYMLTFGNAVVGILTHGAGALVTTAGMPYLVSGVSPDAMQQTPLDVPQAGVSKWAMLSLNGIAIYASNDGIVSVAGGQPNLSLTEQFFTRAIWQQRYGAGLKTMAFAHYDGKVVVFSKTGAFVPFMLDIAEAGGNMTELPQFAASSSITLVTSDQMYMIKGRGLYQFTGGDSLPLRWKSSDIVLPRPASLAMGEAECVGSFVITFYQNGRLCFAQSVATGKTTFRLPSSPQMPPSDRWQFEIAGTGRFKWLKAAGSARELGTV